VASQQQQTFAVDSLNSLGAKHKLKEKEKSEKKIEGLSQRTEKDQGKQPDGTLNGSKASSGSAVDSKNSKGGKDEKDKKKKKKSKDDKDKNGVEGLKRPLSAYMLFNNYRRPILKKEHTSK
jgi:hypothetical protein